MISLIQIKKSIISKLEYLGVNIIADDIKSGFEKPAFFIKLQFFKSNKYRNIKDALITFNIHYFSKEKTDLDNIKMLEKLDELFEYSLDVGNETVALYDVEGEIIDNVLQFKFDLHITELVVDDEIEYEKMQNLFFTNEVN